MATVEEITYLVVYDCPHCRASLQARMRETDAWLRCPACGRGGLPPREALVRQPPPPLDPRDDLIIIPDDVELPPMTSVGVAAFPGDAPVERSRTGRIVSATGLFVAIVFLTFSAIDRSVNGMALFGILAVVCLFFLAVSGRGR